MKKAAVIGENEEMDESGLKRLEKSTELSSRQYRD